jgi:hypothetical protein
MFSAFIVHLSWYNGDGIQPRTWLDLRVLSWLSFGKEPSVNFPTLYIDF